MCFFRQKKRRARKDGSAPRLLACCYLIVPSPPIRAVISSIRSSGKGGSHRGFNAMDMSFMGLSSAATRFELSIPQRLQRWTMAHSPPLRTQTAMGYRDRF